MKKFCGLLLCGSLLLNSFIIQAQSYSESALLYSRVLPAGSARIQALGGAQVSLGGDYSSAGSNPAGLGMFNRSEFTISPGVNIGSSTSQFYTQPGASPTPTKATNGAFEIPGLSFVVHKAKRGDSENNAFVGGSFGFSVSRTNDFNRSFSYQGTNPTTSIIDNFIQTSNNAPNNGDVSQFSPGDPSNNISPGYNYGYPNFFAFDTYLIDSAKSGGKTNYYSVLGTDASNQNDTRKVLQHEDVKISGGQNQANLAYGANFFDKIFIGGGLGIAFLNYQSNKTFSESNYVFAINPNNYNPINSISLNQNLKSNGTGINANLGIIARPVDFIQVGFSYNSPTIYSMHDTYVASMTNSYNNFDVAYYGYPSYVLNGTQTDPAIPTVSQQYTLKTPSRLNLGLTVFVLKQGFITADVERVNYSGAKYSSGSSGIDFSGDNSEIKSNYQATFNYRGGAEYRYKKFRVRGGYSFMPTPNVSNQYYGQNVKQDITSISGGLGYRASKFYIDLSIVARQTSNIYTPYSTYNYNTGADNSPGVTMKNKATIAMVTVGFPLFR